MKRKYIISLIVTLIIIFSVFGVTYSFISSITNKVNTTTTSGKLDINYIEATPLTGKLTPGNNRNSGLKSTAKVNLNHGSLPGSFNMYITPTSISNLNIDAFKWEVEGLRGGQVVYTKNGNFKSASVNTKLKIVDSYVLTNDVTIFNIYIWLDASLLNAGLNNVLFKAKISSDSVPLTGNM